MLKGCTSTASLCVNSDHRDMYIVNSKVNVQSYICGDRSCVDYVAELTLAKPDTNSTFCQYQSGQYSSESSAEDYLNDHPPGSSIRVWVNNIKYTCTYGPQMSDAFY